MKYVYIHTRCVNARVSASDAITSSQQKKNKVMLLFSLTKSFALDATDTQV